MLLGLHGWTVSRALDATTYTGTRTGTEMTGERAGRQVLTLTFVVQRHPITRLQPRPPSAPQPPVKAALPPVGLLELGVSLHRDEALLVAEGEVPEPYQRVAAYVLVTSPRGILMTQFSDQTNAQGQWGLPGGGLEAGEAPDRAALREVWEESGQVIEVGEVALIQTNHWIGRAPAGRLEDFHAVRIVYRGSCLDPTAPVVNDVGGTTAAAAWVPPRELDHLDVAASWRSLLRDLAQQPSGVVMPARQPNDPESHEQDADADDRTWPQL